MPIDKSLIPWDKSWIIRMGVRDLLHGQSKRTLAFLDVQPVLNDDLMSLRNALLSWEAGVPVDVGESGTLYRFLRFADWKFGLGKEFVVRSTLPDRDVCDDPIIVDWPQERLLTLDHGTSQWASAAALCGDTRQLTHPPYKLAVTYQAIKHWNDSKDLGVCWQPRRDKTIVRQAIAFIRMMQGGAREFQPLQAEDFCMAFAFNLISFEEGRERWPQLRGHESNRPDEMATALARAMKGELVTSRDHRVVQAIAMWCAVNKKPAFLKYPSAVNKSWPQFWDFLKRYA